jgi:hypothetical protein
MESRKDLGWLVAPTWSQRQNDQEPHPRASTMLTCCLLRSTGSSASVQRSNPRRDRPEDQGRSGLIVGLRSSDGMTFAGAVVLTEATQKTGHCEPSEMLWDMPIRKMQS